MTAVIDKTRPAHSPLGASGAERWMSCPGSTDLINALSLPQTDEPSWTREGHAMHEAAAHCLVNGLDSWEITGQTFHETVIDEDLMRHVQVYLDHVRGLGSFLIPPYIEYGISSPVHPSFYGTVDFGGYALDRIVVRDFKGGAGIVVEVEENAQTKYYAFGLIEEIEKARGEPLPDDMIVDLGIVQPRAFHKDGPIRTWETTVGAIKAWVHDELVPAMFRAEWDKTLDAGPWCRFCPAKLVCPLLTGLFRAAAIHNPEELIHTNSVTLGESFKLLPAVRFYAKALEDQVFHRLDRGETVEGAVLELKKANRVWRSDGIDEIKALGAEAFSKPELKSVAEIEKLGKEGKALARKWGYTPVGGLKVSLASEARNPVIKQAMADRLAGALEEIIDSRSEEG